ncbi:uncharacterized protein CYBJADRAFT_169905 [Cyberlindnera jadinii NRRL Y-1542]|uniref:DUF1766-domain-containing protein n=1 Tax=Cyberlindnera jadinii (strain ATCC 18201 / CBS 1600 / BCRC 20928 / JCM 3617 / NBRC 0987 / NRRL Y-1542) TaxID=983966 RepID=A0A1E4RUC2_CYBJN|nr:DUF1766-domain-containing protein [Cyberlindnera jadinii NRRL Y-1542]ODV70846.1 DUF1766-domain-containing protein [Cyberlindnera jadinii NRRL Y-1542]
MNQCAGITKQGRRCRIRGTGRYCRYHDPNVRVNEVAKQSRLPDKGFIYVYTLEHLLEKSPKRQEWLQIQPLNSKEFQPFNPKKHILIKVGMTRGSVEKRVRQWQVQCNHKIVIVDPYEHIGSQSLVTMFKCLSVEEDYNHYNTIDKGFKCSQNLFKVEQLIHNKLRDQYGRGDVHCKSCEDQGRSGLHVEWFKIPKKSLKKVYTLIDTTIDQFTAD